MTYFYNTKYVKIISEEIGQFVKWLFKIETDFHVEISQIICLVWTDMSSTTRAAVCQGTLDYQYAGD